MDTVQEESVEWLLYPFIPYGKITILQGDPGEGKTTLALQITLGYDQYRLPRFKISYLSCIDRQGFP